MEERCPLRGPKRQDWEQQGDCTERPIMLLVPKWSLSECLPHKIAVRIGGHNLYKGLSTEPGT